MKSNAIQLNAQIPKVYDPTQVETRWYDEWVKRGYFNADVRPDKTPYTIVIPPPNVTSALHIGHAFNNTIQDVFIRYHRKKGYETLWLPGTDHAGIATQNVVEKELRKEGLTRHDLGREAFVKRVWEWKEKNGSTIIRQLKRMGCSCDWRRERFTRDEEYSRAVLEVFIRLYKKGWIYRGNYIINWCPRCSTALSDEEVEHQEHQGHLWYIRYPLKDSDAYVVVATTRPETMLGDTAVMVHPEDERYRQFIGKTAVLPLLNREIPVIADEHVDPEFGTGAVKVTPAHDPNDFEVGNRHHLPQINILNGDGTLNENAGPYAGLDRFEARKRVVEDLKRRGLLEKIEPHVHSVGHCQRCHTVVEPYLSTQWFVRMKEMAKPALKAVLEGEIKLHPEERWIKTYIHWMENIRDWCISRQLWWGHQIPVFYCDNCEHMMVQHEAPQRCEKCGSNEIHQDEDVLDTWFSSWLWPFATLGWPEDTPELRYFYPTDTLVTGADILFFWVARMIMAGYEFMGEKPFKDVYLNGIVRDAQGRKMSKSLGNGIDPLDIIEKYSADALRFTLLMLSSEGQDINLAESHFEIGRNFSNKLWNAYRFLALNIEEPNDNFREYGEHLELADRWILSRLHRTIQQVSESIDTFRLSDSLKAVYHFFWDELCDWYLELIKSRLTLEGDHPSKEVARRVATYVMKQCMNLLHPYIPFITEEIWQRLKNSSEESVVISPWPEAEEAMIDSQAEEEMRFIQEVITGIRATRSEMNVPPSRKSMLLYRTGNSTVEERLTRYASYITQLARTEAIRPVTDENELKGSAALVVDQAELFIPLAELIDVEAEKQRLEKEISRVTQQMAGLQKKLSNEDFLQKAPEAVVQNTREKLHNLTEKLNKLKANLGRLK
ncbi:MAG: valine--tRNA ligase [Calditrichaeota bacterium]|nr:MAG: valine--tRNA ligase [Calditrichota bacterium]